MSPVLSDSIICYFYGDADRTRPPCKDCMFAYFDGDNTPKCTNQKVHEKIPNALVFDADELCSSKHVFLERARTVCKTELIKYNKIEVQPTILAQAITIIELRDKLAFLGCQLPGGTMTKRILAIQDLTDLFLIEFNEIVPTIIPEDTRDKISILLRRIINVPE